mmetsp:Transcript_3479/g.6190  ORF Transcript_3479/g.6190 Transcript_3479/m.6190 type:complete len:128 (-) Transcript_3479:117-500(-)
MILYIGHAIQNKAFYIRSSPHTAHSIMNQQCHLPSNPIPIALNLRYSSSITLFNIPFDDTADESAMLFAPTIICGTDATDMDATLASASSPPDDSDEWNRTRGLLGPWTGMPWQNVGGWGGGGESIS